MIVNAVYSLSISLSIYPTGEGSGRGQCYRLCLATDLIIRPIVLYSVTSAAA